MTAEPQMIPAWVDGVLQPVEKLAVHQRALRHKAVSVFVINDDLVLIQQRAAGKYHTPNLWANTCCTHPSWNETPLACAQRRLHEELGITGLDLVSVGQVEYQAGVGNGLVEHELVDVFVAQAPLSLSLDPDRDEVAATRWIARDRLLSEMRLEPARFTPWLHIYLTEHHDQIFATA